MSRNEDELFYKKLAKFNNMISSMSSEDAIDYLVESNVYRNREECIQHLSQYATIDAIIDQIPPTKNTFKYVDKEFSKYMRRRILDEILTKVVRGDALPYRYLDLISMQCNFLNGDYEYKESNYYLAHEMLPIVMDEIENTCKRFSFKKISDIENLYAADILMYNLKYIECYGKENKEDQELLDRIHVLFPEENIPAFCNKPLPTINIMELENTMDSVNYHTNGYYSIRKNMFYTDELHEIMNDIYDEDKEEDENYSIELDKKEILERFISSLSSKQIEQEQLYDRLYGRKAFQNCKKAFSRLGILNQYYEYEQAELTLACIGWCIKHGFSYGNLKVNIDLLSRN